MKESRIMLTGFMGSGKTTVARALARRLDYPFVDTDKYIEQCAGMSVSEIFRKHGEQFFRTLEHNVTFDFLKDREIVVSSGGGYILTNVCYQLAWDNFTIFYIDTPVDKCLRRIGIGVGRPLAAGKSAEDITELYKKRAPVYRTRCTHVINGDQTVDKIVDDIVKLL